MSSTRNVERIQTVIIGAGQSGLSVGYHLAKRGLPFVILEANDRVGDTWRRRWDSLRLFTPARYDGLVGMSFPAPRFAFPTKDEMADYLEHYAANFKLPVRTGVRVERVSRRGNGFLVAAGDTLIEADQVVIAMANYQKPFIPPFADQLSPDIVQLHSIDYRSPSQLREGPVLLVGAGNSGSEIALDVARAGHKAWMSGRDTGYIPFRIAGFAGRHVFMPLLLRVVFHRVLTTDTPMGRGVRGKMHAAPLIRVKAEDLAGAGVERAPRTAGVLGGKPLLEDARVLDVANVVWCTGFYPGFDWLDMPVFEPNGQPRHIRGVSTDAPGLFFVGLHFLYSMSSTMIHAAARDSAHVATAVAERIASHAKTQPTSLAPSFALPR